MERNKLSASKWVATAASIWIQCTTGSLYTFGIYSSALKSSQSYSQSTLDTLSVFKDVGGNTGLLSGLLYSTLAVRGGPWFTGPWVVLAAGAIQSFAGYFLMWLAVVGVISQPPVIVMCLFMLLAAHAQTFANTADVVTAVNNFPDYSGTVVGIMKVTQLLPPLAFQFIMILHFLFLQEITLFIYLETRIIIG